MPVGIVRVGPGDTDLVMRAAFLFDAPPTDEFTARFLDSPGHHLLLALDGDEPIGFVTGIEVAHPDKPVELLVYELGVDENHRRRGVATALLDALAALATEFGCRGLWVLTEPDNSAATATYRSAGYVAGDPTVLFEREL